MSISEEMVYTVAVASRSDSARGERTTGTYLLIGRGCWIKRLVIE